MTEVSVVIPTKNEEKNIIKCLNSILIQKQKKIEVLIIDSYSKDQTVELIKKLKIKNKRRDISIKILDNFPKEVQDYNNGKDKLMGFFVGQIMKETKGKANPKILNKIVVNLLEEKK